MCLAFDASSLPSRSSCLQPWTLLKRVTCAYVSCYKEQPKLVVCAAVQIKPAGKACTAQR